MRLLHTTYVHCALGLFVLITLVFSHYASGVESSGL